MTIQRTGFWGDPCEYVYRETFDFTPGPIETIRMGHILQIAQRIMENENSRRTPYLGTHIYPERDRLYYAVDGDHRYYLEFKTPEMAQHFCSVLQGILMLSISRFAMDEEREPSVLPTRKSERPETKYVRSYANKL